MRRHRSVKALECGLRVVVDITVEADNARLGRDEVNTLTDHLTDEAMRAVSEARFVSTPISKLKVSR